MSGDWIKMRVNLGDDPRVTVIADTLRLHRDAVIGKLYRLWAWADQHTIDGITPVKSKWVDEFVGKIGFAAAMHTARWLEVDEDGTISFPDFEVHNGTSAKSRALDAKRKQGDRKSGERPQKSGQMSGPQPDKTRTREEKRSVEKNLKPGSVEVTPTDNARAPNGNGHFAIENTGDSKPIAIGETIVEPWNASKASIAATAKTLNVPRHEGEPFNDWKDRIYAAVETVKRKAQLDEVERRSRAT